VPQICRRAGGRQLRVKGNVRTARPRLERPPRAWLAGVASTTERMRAAVASRWRGTQRGPSGRDLWRTCATAAADRAACACGWFRLGGVLRKTTGILLARPITKQTISRTKARRRAGAPIPRDARTNKAQAADGNPQCRRRSVVVDDTDNHHTGWRAHAHALGFTFTTDQKLITHPDPAPIDQLIIAARPEIKPARPACETPAKKSSSSPRLNKALRWQLYIARGSPSLPHPNTR